MPQNPSRRHFLRTTTLATAATIIAPRFLQSQIPDRVLQAREAAQKTPIKTTKLYDNVFLLQGAGGNIALQTGPEGHLLIDSSFATAVPAILSAAKAAGPGAPKTLINTHWHYDHTDGNENLHSAGYTITAHTKTRERLSTPQHIRAFNLNFPPNPAGAIPTITFDATKSISQNGDTLELVHFDPAHTDTDIYIHFQKANVLHCGDTFFNGFYPFIDDSSGGSIGGMIRANEKALALANADTKIIPGHGTLGTKADLQAVHDMLSGVREKVASLKSSGLTEQEVIAKKPTAQWDAKWANGMLNGDAITGLAYRTL